MTDPTVTEVLGKTINSWDRFYNRNFEWVYRHTLEFCHNTLKAKDLTDRIFAKVLLSHPEIIVDNDVQSIKDKLGIWFPYLGIKADTNKELSAGRLLHLYYQPN